MSSFRMKRFFVAMCLIFLGISVYAQNIAIKGTVKDEKGQPVIGAAVMLEGNTKVGAVTDLDGKYTLSIPSVKNPRLVVNCVSYKEEIVSVGSRAVIDIILKEDAELLEEVVVVGYGAMRRSDLTGSVTSVKMDEDAAIRSTTLDQMLGGRAAGVQVIASSAAPDAGVNIRIRGLGSFTGSSEPLYVVDGIIINGESQSLSTIGRGADATTVESTNGLAGINPQDIASMEILKDASATAIYGSQGANGVVLITTKQGNSAKPKVNFNAGVAVSHRMHKLSVLDFDQYLDFLDVLNTNGAEYTLSDIFKDPNLRDENGKHVLGDNLEVIPIDWQDYVMRTAISQRYYLSVSGSPKSYKYLFSVGYNHGEGILKNSSSDNVTMRLNLDKKLSKNLEVGFKSGFAYTFSNLVNGAAAGYTLNGASGILRSMLRTRPWVYSNPDDMEGTIGGDDELMYGPNRWLNESKNTSERYRINPSVYVWWRILPWLSFKSTLGGDFEITSRVKTRSIKLSPTDGNMAGYSMASWMRYNMDNTFNINKSFRRHRINVNFGQTLSRTFDATTKGEGWNLPNKLTSLDDLNYAASDYTSFGFSEISNSTMSFFARAVYNYDDRYVFTATYRLDGSSRFQKKNRWSSFPSFAFAWRIADEPWFNVPLISNAKLRIGWGLTGSQGISSYQTLPTFGSSSVGDHSSISGAQTAIYPSNVQNPDLKWQSSEQYNIGLDLSLWRGRFTLTYDMYQKDTRDLLQWKQVALSTGFSTIAMNDGAIRNRGIELTVNAVPLQVAGVEWQIGGNISFNRNTILSVGESGTSAEIWLAPGDKRNVKYFDGLTLQNSGNLSPLNIFIEGQSMGLFYGYKMEGIVQEGETGPGFKEGETRGPGYIKYADLNGNKYIDEGDRTIIGDPLPDFTYGFNTILSWKGLSVNAQFSGVYGADIFNLNNTQEYDSWQTTHNVRSEAVLGAWTPENKSNKWPGIGKMDGTNDGIFSTRTVEDASYLSLDNLTVSYAIPLNKKKVKVIDGIEVALSCTNVFIATKYSGWSPKNNSFGSNVKRMGIDLATYPIPRTYSIDLKFRF